MPVFCTRYMADAIIRHGGRGRFKAILLSISHGTAASQCRSTCMLIATQATMVETRMDYYIFLWYIVNMAQHVGLVVNAAA